MLKIKLTSDDFANLSDTLKTEYQLQADGSYKLDLGPDVFPPRFIHTPETPERKMGRRIG